MKVAVLGRSEILYGVVEAILENDHEVTSIVSPSEAPEYSRTSEDFRSLANEHEIPFSSGLPMSELKSFLQVGAPVIGVSVNYPVLVSSGVIDSFPLGILNVHGGDLPRYRGNACQAWAILDGEERIGLCVHKMEGGKLDTGDIISRDYFPIDLSTNITTVHGWIVETSPGLVLEALASLDNDPDFLLEKQSNSGKRPLRCFPRRPVDARIDWALSALEIVRLVKASSRPYRGAYCFLDGEEITVWDAEISSVPYEFRAVPGQIVEISHDEIIVAAGKGAISLKAWEVNETMRLEQPLVRSIRQRFT